MYESYFCKEDTEDMILQMANIVLENRELREENFELKRRLKIHEDNSQRQFEESKQRIANTLNIVLNKGRENKD